MKLWHICCTNRFCELECACYVAAETKEAAKEAARTNPTCTNPNDCKNADPCAYEIAAVFDKAGNKFRVMLIPDLSCEGGGCCVRCGKTAEAKTDA